MKITTSGALMFLLSAVATRNTVAFTPKNLSFTRNYHRSVVALNAEKGGQKQGGELLKNVAYEYIAILFFHISDLMN